MGKVTTVDMEFDFTQADIWHIRRRLANQVRRRSVSRSVSLEVADDGTAVAADESRLCVMGGS